MKTMMKKPAVKKPTAKKFAMGGAIAMPRGGLDRASVPPMKKPGTVGGPMIQPPMKKPGTAGGPMIQPPLRRKPAVVGQGTPAKENPAYAGTMINGHPVPVDKPNTFRGFAKGGAVAKNKPVKKYADGGFSPDEAAAAMQQKQAQMQQQATLRPAGSMQERVQQDFQRQAAEQKRAYLASLGENTQRAVYGAEKAMQRPSQAVNEYARQQYGGRMQESNTMSDRFKLQADIMADKQLQTMQKQAKKTAEVGNANIKIAQQRDAAAAEKKKINDFIMSQKKKPKAAASYDSGGENQASGFAKGGVVKKKSTAMKGKKK